jgi:hypothetical protein
MAFSESLAARTRQQLARRKGVREKKMFGIDQLSDWIQQAVKFVAKLPGKSKGLPR